MQKHPYGDAGIFLDRPRRQPLAPAVLRRAHPTRFLLRPLLVVVPQVGIEHATELGYHHARPVAVVEELTLDPAKESLHL